MSAFMPRRPQHETPLHSDNCLPACGRVTSSLSSLNAPNMPAYVAYDS